MNQIKVKNIFAAVFEKSVLNGLLEVLDRQTDKGGTSDSRTDFEIRQIRFWGTEGTIRYVKSKGFWGKSVIRGFDYGGRVKSLDRTNFVRILADSRKSDHARHLKKEKLEAIDLVVVDLYAPDPKIFPESMDIGGQSLIRSAIKNYKNVTLAFDKKSISDLIKELKSHNGSTTLAFRKSQAKKATKFIAQRTKLEANMFDKV